MVETAVHLIDHVFPRLPVRQWLLSVPKRLRYFMKCDGGGTEHGAAQVDRAALQMGAVAFIHRFGSSLNQHVHFHVCVADGVFEAVAGEGTADAEVQASSPGVVFHPATAIDQTAVA
jgi:hypothetical protein